MKTRWIAAPLFAAYLVMLPAFATVYAQQDDENDPAKAAALIKEAVKARGGDAYLRVTTMVSRGQYTSYDKGVSGNPVSFVDYIAYPGRERTEFGTGNDKFV